jgi:hypothetical protein
MRTLMVGAGSVVVGLLGGNLIGAVLFALGTPGWKPSYDDPGGVVLALLQGIVSAFLTFYLCRKLSGLELARKMMLAACVACAIFAATNLLILGFSDGPMPWQAAASIASFAPWLVATRMPQLVEDLTA